MVSSCFTNRATRNQTCWRRSKKSVLFNLMAAKSKYTVHEKRLLTATEGVQEVSRSVCSLLLRVFKKFPEASAHCY